MARAEEERTAVSGEHRTESIVIDRGVNFFERRTDLFGDHLERTKHLPEQLIARYLREAIKSADLKRLEDGTWFGEITTCPGVWASADEPDQAILELKDVLFDWVVLKIEHGDRDLPQFGEINLNLI